MNDELDRALAELHEELEETATAIAPTCSSCVEYVPSTTAVGICKVRVCYVMEGDQTCTFYLKGNSHEKVA